MLLVHVPIDGATSTATVLPRSAIVSDPARDADLQDGRLCYYEGGRYNPKLSFYDKLALAAGRLHQDYPTTAKIAVPTRDLVAVARFDPDRLVVTELLDADRLSAWAGEEIEAIAGRRVPPGPIDWAAAAALCESAKPLPPHGPVLFFRTRAGQVLRFDGRRRVATAFEHDDPELRRLLAAGLPRPQRRLVFGEDTTLD